MKEKWPSVKLEEICAQITDGKHGDCQDDEGSGFYFISCKDVADGKIIYVGARQIAEADFIDTHRRTKLEPSDILVTNSGTIGRMAIAPDTELTRRTTFQKSVAILKPIQRRADPTFLYYRLHSDIRRLIEFAGGTAQKNLLLRDLRAFRVEIPPLALQRRIKNILSAYDELIENCQRRIRSLEEMARAIYREWFVQFRFPGHKHVALVDSPLGPIPNGWEMKPLVSLMTDQIGGGWGQDVPDDDHTESAWVIRGTDIPDARICQVAKVPFRYHTKSNLNSRRLQAADILFEVSGGSKGQPVGRALLVTPQLLSTLSGDNVICASFCKRIRPDLSGYGSELLYLSFVEGYESGEIEQFQVQSTGITNFKWTEYIHRVQRVIPPESLRSRFRSIVAPLFMQVGTLGLKIANLRRTRDLLLPRLLSGQVSLDVSAVEDVAEPTAPAPPLSQTDLASEEPALRAAEEAPPYRVERAGHDLPPPAEPADEAPVPIDQIDRTEVLQVIRQVFSEGPPRERDAAIRDVARALGYRRTGARIHEILHTDLLTAVRRGILENTGGELRLLTRSITDYERDFLKQQFLAAIGRPWIDRDTATRDFCRWLGFARTGPVIEDTTRSLINGLLREGRLEADGADLIRSV